jgi:hypothetical protein
MKSISFVKYLIIVCLVIFSGDYKNLCAEEYRSETVVVSGIKELRTAVSAAEPGDEILIEPGFYKNGFGASHIFGTKEKPVIISGSDLKNPPVFTGKGDGIKLSNVSYLKLSNIKIIGFSGNGINIDDGGDFSSPSHHIVLENILLLDIGSGGNQDAIKLSGVDNFIIKNSSINGWGGSGIDLVGCHSGIIDNVLLKGKAGFRTGNGMQIKGGSSDILVQRSVFMNSGARAVNIGGLTGKKYFRPSGTDYEAENIIIGGNKFIGGEAHIAWVTCTNTVVKNNIFYLPVNYVCRILQETKDDHFKPSSNGVFMSNFVVTDKRLKTYVNIGPDTAPDTFRFIKNAWYSFGSEEKPLLPTKEKDGIYNVYPDLYKFGTPEMKIASTDKKLSKTGPGAYSPLSIKSDFDDIKIPDLSKSVTQSSVSTYDYSGQTILTVLVFLAGLFIVLLKIIKK